MKLVLLLHSLGAGGAERVGANLANRWVERGWSVAVITLSSEADDQYALHPGVRRIGLDLAAASDSLFRAVVANLRRVRAVRRAIRAERPAVILGMMTTANILLALATVGMANVYRIGSERIHPPRYPLGRVWEWLRARSYRLLDVVVVPAGEMREWLVSKTSARRVVVIPNPVAWPLIVETPVIPPASVGVAAHRRLLAVGRLEAQKGFDVLIEAFAGLWPSFQDWELVILGEGPDRGELERMIAARGLSDAIHLPGRVGNVGEWYETADLFVLSSRFEGFPNALVEAMSYGVAVVSTNCETGPREIVRQDVDGLLVAPGDAPAMREALGRLMREPETRASYAARAMDVRERFAPARIDALWGELFAGVAGAMV